MFVDCRSKNTKSLAKEFSEILIFEYFGYFKIGFDVFLTLIPNHPRMTSGKNANLRSNGRKTHFYVAMGQSSAKREKRLHFSFGLGFGIGLGYGLGSGLNLKSGQKGCHVTAHW